MSVFKSGKSLASIVVVLPESIYIVELGVTSSRAFLAIAIFFSTFETLRQVIMPSVPITLSIDLAPP